MKQQHSFQSSAQPCCFFTTSKSHKALAATHSKIMASSLGHHFHYCTCICTFQQQHEIIT